MKNKKLLVLVNELKKDKEKIKKYIEYHDNPFPEIVNDLEKKPIGRMRIYHNQNKLVMLLEVEKDFDLSNGIHIDPIKGKVEEWQNIMGELFEELESGQPRSWELTEKYLILKIITNNRILKMNKNFIEFRGNPNLDLEKILSKT